MEKQATYQAQDYYPFGFLMPSRSFTGASGYRFGFNGKEKDDEGMGGGGATYDYGFRIYNPQIAKFLSVDPLTKSFPFYTPYQFASNTPIAAIDVDGKEADIIVNSPQIATTMLEMKAKGDIDGIFIMAGHAAMGLGGQQGYAYTCEEAEWANKQNGQAQQGGDNSAQTFNVNESSTTMRVFIINGDGDPELLVEKEFPKTAEPKVKASTWWSKFSWADKIKGNTEYKDGYRDGEVVHDSSPFEQWLLDNTYEKDREELQDAFGVSGGFGGSVKDKTIGNNLEFESPESSTIKNPLDLSDAKKVPDVQRYYKINYWMTGPGGDTTGHIDYDESNNEVIEDVNY